VDAADLEAEFLPTLQRSSSLLARALGRSSAPAWLQERSVEGTVQIDRLLLPAAEMEDVRGRLVWETTGVEISAFQARLATASVNGLLHVNLRGRRPAYRFQGRVRGLNWQSGKLDAQGSMETFGTGLQLLTNLKSEGEFAATALDFGPSADWRAISGTYSLAWNQAKPHLQLSDLKLRAEDETYTGQGATQEDGGLVLLLSNGKELRMTGPLAKLKMDEPVP
jgi:hypothetical protein